MNVQPSSHHCRLESIRCPLNEPTGSAGGSNHHLPTSSECLALALSAKCFNGLSVWASYQKALSMIGVMLSADDINAAPPEVLCWVQQQALLAVDATRDVHPSIHPEPLPAVVRPTTTKSGLTALAPPEPKPCWLTEAPKMDQQTERDNRAAIQKLIAERAYELWEDQGHPQGYDLIHWQEAEKEIMGCVNRLSLSDNNGKTE